MNAGEVAVAPEAGQVHSLAALGFDQARQPVKRPEVVVSVDGRNRVESGLQAAVGRRVARFLRQRPTWPIERQRTHAVRQGDAWLRAHDASPRLVPETSVNAKD